MKDKYITCKTEAEYKELMKALEKDGYKWSSGQSLTSDSVYHYYGKDIVLRLYPNKRVTFANRDFYERNCGVKNFIPATEYIGNNKLVVYRNGNVVTAVNKTTRETGIAKCSPTDEFNFHTGASIALARLMAKTPEVITADVKAEWKKVLGIEDIPARVDHKFNVGDYVTLKEGLTSGEFYGGLELLSGAMYDNAHNKRMTVVHVDWSDDSGTYYCECKGDSQFTFHYSEEMLDKWDESKIHEGDTVKVINTGLNYSSSPQWVGKHISDPYMAARYCYGSPNTDRKYKVIKIAEHEDNGRTLAFIEECDGFIHNRCYLIEVKGLEKV